MIRSYLQEWYQVIKESIRDFQIRRGKRSCKTESSRQSPQSRPQRWGRRVDLSFPLGLWSSHRCSCCRQTLIEIMPEDDLNMIHHPDDDDADADDHNVDADADADEL